MFFCKSQKTIIMPDGSFLQRDLVLSKFFPSLLCFLKKMHKLYTDSFNDTDSWGVMNSVLAWLRNSVNKGHLWSFSKQTRTRFYRLFNVFLSQDEEGNKLHSLLFNIRDWQFLGGQFRIGVVERKKFKQKNFICVFVLPLGAINNVLGY